MMVLKRSLWAENRLIGKHYRPRSDNAEYKNNMCLMNSHVSVENYEKNIYLLIFVFPGFNILK